MMMEEEEINEITDSEENVYNDDARQGMMEDDEISVEEEGFMKGYNEDENSCQACGAMIDSEKSVKKEIDGKILNFCSEKCADSFDEF